MSKPQEQNNMLKSKDDAAAARGDDTPLSEEEPRSPSPPKRKMTEIKITNYARLVGRERHNGPFTPGLEKYVRYDLITHVQGWEATRLEQEADKVAKVVHELKLKIAAISAELNVYRAQVRHNSIHCSMMEARIMFIEDRISYVDKAIAETDNAQNNQA